MGFFTGIFLAAYQVGVEVVFLKTPGLGDENLDKAMFAAGGFGLLSTFIFVWLQNRISYSTLALFNLITFTIFLIGISVLFEYHEVGPAEHFQIESFKGISDEEVVRMKRGARDYFVARDYEIPNLQMGNVVDSLIIESRQFYPEIEASLTPEKRQLIQKVLGEAQIVALARDTSQVEATIDRLQAAWVPEVSDTYRGIVFLSFMMLGPILATILLGFWGTFNRLFTLRQSKRIIGGIDTGQLTATIIAFFAIGALPDIFRSADLILLSAVCITGALIFLIIIVRSYDLDALMREQAGQEKVKRTSYLGLFVDKYLKWLCLFLILSMVATVVMDFAFLSTINVYYPIERELQQYIAFFSAVIMLVSFIIQTFINDIIIGKYGLKVSLLVMPAILALFCLGAIAGGHYYVYNVKTDDLIYFFLFISMGKLFSAAFKDALENPAFKLYFLPLEIKVRFDIQTKVEGVINELASLVAGTLLVVLSLEFIGLEVIHFCYLILVVTISMYFVAVVLFERYKDTLKSTLERYKKAQVQDGHKEDRSLISLLQSEMGSSKSAKVIFAAKLMEKVEPILLESSLANLIKSTSSEIREYAVQRINQLKSLSLLDSVKEQIEVEDSPEIKDLAQQAVARLSESDSTSQSAENLKKLVRSTNSDDRVFAAKILGRTSEDIYLRYLTELIRDINPKVRVSALVTAGQLKNPEFWPYLIENLVSPQFSNAAASALVAIGADVNPSIEAAYNKTGQKTEVMSRIVQILGRIGGREAEELLWKKIDSNDKEVFTQVLLSLNELGYKARELQAARIKITIEADIEDVQWNLQALNFIPDDEENQLLREAIKAENQYNYDHIYMLLSMNFDPQSIQLVKENIETGLDDNITFAIELLDVFLTEDLKPKLFPILDDLEFGERMSKLEEYYAPENFESLEAVYIQIINRDYNHINRWTKALAMYSLAKLPESKHVDVLVANLFNPDHMLREIAAWALVKLDRSIYQENSYRLPRNIKKELDKIVLPSTYTREVDHQKMLHVERVMFLRQIEEFKKIPGVVLAELNDSVQEKKYTEGDVIINQGDNGDTPIFLVVKGTVEVLNGDQKVDVLEERAMIGEMNVLESDINDLTYLATNETLLFLISKDKFYELMSKNHQMANGVIDFLERKFDPTATPKRKELVDD